MDKIKLLIDTDMGSDCDDVAAVAIASWLHKIGEVEIIGITHTSNNPRLYEYINSVTRYYGDLDCPIGVSGGKAKSFGKLSDEFIESVTKGFDYKKAPEKVEDSVDLMRRLLANNRNVKIVGIGPMNNFSALLQSEADEISPLSGVELVKQSVVEYVQMGGIFEDKIYKFGNYIYDIEFNIKCDIPACKYSLENCPVPMTFIEFELGYNVQTFERTTKSDVSSPIKRSYKLFKVEKRESWDPIAVIYSVYGLCNGLYRYSDDIEIKVDETGHFITKKGGNCRYLIELATKKEITDFINSFESKIIRGGIL